MTAKRTPQEVESRWLTIQEVRLVSDLRIMHAKVDEIYEIVKALRTRRDEAAIVRYADQPVLTDDIQKIDEIYLWLGRIHCAERVAREFVSGAQCDAAASIHPRVGVTCGRSIATRKLECSGAAFGQPRPRKLKRHPSPFARNAIFPRRSRSVQTVSGV